MLESDLAKFQFITKQLLEAEQITPVLKPIKAKQLFEHLDLNLEEEGIEDDDFYSGLEKLVLNTPRTASVGFFNQLFGGRKSKAILGDLLSVMLNNSMYTYKVAGPMVGLEKSVLRSICDIIDYGALADGTFSAGGSMSNFMAMTMARDVCRSSIRKEGVFEKMVVYTSAHSHYSIPKNAALLGIGRDQVRKIPVDDSGVMKVDELEEQIEADKLNGFVPFFVNATAGTTVLGAFDPIDAISDICKSHKIWLHVDGAYCGAVIFSNKYKHLISGLEKSDSFSVNAHKMLGTPLTCSILVTQNRKHIIDSFSNDASYLYQSDDDEFNLGKTSFQCGRRNDALKFWTLWKSIGTKGLREMVDHQFDLSKVARDYIKDHSDYELYSFDESISVCFNYKGIDARALCTALYEDGQLMVGYGSFDEQEFIRLVTINSENTEIEILNFFETLENYVERNAHEFYILEDINS